MGTTPDTSNILKTYKTLALQLHYIINLKKMENDNENYESYRKCFDLTSLIDYIVLNLNELNRIEPNKKVIIILDSLDQLNKEDFKNVDLWLIRNLPKNTKYIVSTIPGHGNLLSMITKMIKKQYVESQNISDESTLNKKVNEKFQEQLLHVNQLTPDESEDILTVWLSKVNHALTDEQWSTLRYMFKNGKVIGLYLKLLFDIVVRWRSFDKPDHDLAKCLKVDDMIIYRFHDLEKIHGKVLFRRAICYLSVCKNGLSDNEICDLLSLDDDVLYSVFEFSMPPIRRLPAILWVRINLL